MRVLIHKHLGLVSITETCLKLQGDCIDPDVTYVLHDGEEIGVSSHLLTESRECTDPRIVKAIAEAFVKENLGKLAREVVEYSQDKGQGEKIADLFDILAPVFQAQALDIAVGLVSRISLERVAETVS